MMPKRLVPRAAAAALVALAALTAGVAGPGAGALAAGGVETDLGVVTDPGAAPTNLQAVGGNWVVQLRWDPPAKPGQDVLFYNIYFWEGPPKGDPRIFGQVSADILGYNDFLVVNGQAYSYQVKAQYDNKAESLPTESVTVTPTVAGLSVVLYLGQAKATVNGAEVSLDAPAQLISGATMVPLRFVASSLGADVKYDAGPRLVTVILGPKTVRLWIGRNEAEIDGQKTPIAHPPCLASGRTMVPIRFIGEAFGAQVGYSQATGEVTVDMADTDADQATATALTVGAACRAALNGSNDVDYYRLDPDPGESYVVRTHDLSNGCNTALAMVHSGGWTVSDDAGSDLASEIQVYGYGDDTSLFIRVQSAVPGGANPSGNYSLTVEARADDPSAVTRLTVGAEEVESGLTSPSDFDRYVFAATAGAYYHILGDNLPDPVTDEVTTDTRLYLWGLGAEGQPIYLNCDDDSSLSGYDPRAAEMFWLCPATGDYYLEAGAASGCFGPYALTVETFDPRAEDALFCLSESREAAFTLVPDDEAWRYWIIAPDAQGWYYFEAVEGTSYYVQTYELAPFADTIITLFGGPGGAQELARNDDAPGRSYGSAVEWKAPWSGRVDVRVTGYQGPGFTCEGGYVICVTTTAPEVDDYWSLATPLDPSGEAVRASLVSADLDLFYFEAKGGLTYTIETFDLGPQCDTYLEVWDEDDNSDSNDDIEGGDRGSFASRVTFTAVADGTVYVRVSMPDNLAEGYKGTGPYSIKVTVTGKGTSF